VPEFSLVINRTTDYENTRAGKLEITRTRDYKNNRTPNYQLTRNSNPQIARTPEYENYKFRDYEYEPVG
jgi:hypothetical protein